MATLNLVSVTISDYKSFVAETELVLSPMTLVYGENSAGKSSLLRLLVSIAEAIRTKSRHAVLPIIRGPSAGFKDVLGSKSKVELTLSFLTGSTTTAAFKCSLQLFPELNSVKVVEVKLLADDTELMKLQIVGAPQSNEFGTFALTSKEETASVELVEFEGILPYVVDANGNRSGDEHKLLRDVRETMVKFSEHLVWIGPLRHTPPKDITLTPCPQKFLQDGSDIVQLLHPANPMGKALTEFVSNWYAHATKHELSVSTAVYGQHEIFSVLLAPQTNAHLQVPISEHGAGMAQVLPIVIACGLARLSNVPFCLVFENPELHLHDGVHEKLAELLADTASSVDGARIVTETHSENMLLTLQLKSILGKGTAPIASVNWVQKDSEGNSTCRHFSFDEEGSLGGLWSKSIFGYTGELARRILKARTDAKASENAN